jgi:RNA polymerase sigma-70 factor (ECF subfamily)
MMSTGGTGLNDDRFEAIYRKHYARVWRYYRACRVTDDESHDLAQDAFKRLYERMESIRNADEWPFLEAIARSVLYNHIRARKTGKRSGAIVEIDDPELLFEVPAPPERDYAERETASRRRKDLAAAVRELSAGQQQCLRLWIQGFKYEDIQKTLGITLDVVKSRLRDAKKLLRDRMGEKS